MNPLFSKKFLGVILSIGALSTGALFSQSELPAGHPPIGPSAGSDSGQGGTPAAHPPMDAGSGSDMPTAPSGSPPSPVSKDGTLDLEKVTYKVPSGWTYEAPSSRMRQAQFVLPKYDGDDSDADLAIFYFGPQGGSVEDNIKRWYSQFEQPDGKTSESVAKRETVKAGPVDVTLVDLSGTMKPSMMSASPGGPKTNYRMIGAIAEMPSGPWFVKVTGPSKTVEKHAKAIREFATSVKAK